MEATTSSLTLHTLRELYLRHAATHYRRRSGEQTREALNIKAALDRFIAYAGGESKLAVNINRHQVRAWVDQLASEELSRVYVNQCLSRVRRWVRWAADWDLIPFRITEELRLVRPLLPFRSNAKESTPATPPSMTEIDKVLAFLPSIARDVLLLEKHTGARPSELLALTNAEIIVDDRGAWIVPAQHKNAHHGHTRMIPLSPAALAIVEYRRRPLCPADFLFEARYGEGHYSITGFRAALRRACKLAEVPVFTPRSVRYAVARHVRKHRGLDAAQALLGHSSAETTEIYAPLHAGDTRTMEAARSATEVLG